MLETTITLVGNLVDDPEHRLTTSGASVCTFRLASTPRRFDRSENRWVDGATLFLRVSCWRQLADNVSASLARGDRALVYGRLRQRSFETGEGERRVSYEIDADAVGAELTWHAARSARPGRRSSESSAPAEIPAQSQGAVGTAPVGAPRHPDFEVTGGGESYAGAEGPYLGAGGRAPVAGTATGAPTGPELVGAGVGAGFPAPAAMRGDADSHVPVSGLTAGSSAAMDASRVAADQDNGPWRTFASSDDLR